MRRRSDEKNATRAGGYVSPSPGVTRLDRETLEGVMRQDVFLAADGKALAIEAIELWTQSRRDGRRS
jgi:hypothetical protein